MEKTEAFFKSTDSTDTAVYKVIEMSERHVTVIEVAESGIIIYDTEISNKAYEDKFNCFEYIQIKREEFDAKMIEKLNKNEEK